MRLAGGVRAFVSGPVWAVGGAVSALLTAIAAVQALTERSAWMWLFFAALALVIAAFYTFYRGYVQREKAEAGLPNSLEHLLEKGMAQLDQMTATQSAHPQRVGPWDDQIKEAEDFFHEARQLLIEHNKRSFLDDLGTYANETRQREREKRNRGFQRIAEREEAGEEVSNADKMRAWGESLRREGTGEMEAMLAAVAKVTKELRTIT